MSPWIALAIEVISFGLQRFPIGCNKQRTAQLATTYLRESRNEAKTRKREAHESNVGTESEGFTVPKAGKRRNEGRADLSILLAVSVVVMIVFAFLIGRINSIQLQ